MIAATLIVLFATISARSLRYGVLVFLASLPLYLARFDVGPVPTTVLEAMFGVLVLRWLWELRQRPEARHVLRAMWRRPLVRFVTIGGALVAIGGLLGLVQSADIASSLGVWKSYLLEPLIFLFVLMSTFGAAEHRRATTDMLTALSIPVMLIGLAAMFQYVTRLGIPAEWYLEGRVTSIFPYPNAVAHFTTPIAVAALVALTHRATHAAMARWQRWLLAIAAALGLTATALVQSEAAIIAAAVVLLGIALHRARAHSPKRFVLALAFAALVAFAIMLSPLRDTVVEKLTLQDWSGQTRRAVYQETFALLTHDVRTFALGVGPNNYPIALAPFHTHDYLETFQYPHNIVLNIWVEAGLLGVAGFLTIAAALAHAAFRARQIASPVAIAALAVMLIHGLVDVPYFKNDLAFLTWAFVALIVIAIPATQKPSPQRS